jgi:predicted transcriptional regulator
MSIAVMNWVWANSPASGNERLVLLALADACSRDDGTDCWPSAATIARKANISDRTVRRVIARLEADGHVMVHRGGGRGWIDELLYRRHRRPTYPQPRTGCHP